LKVHGEAKVVKPSKVEEVDQEIDSIIDEFLSILTNNLNDFVESFSIGHEKEVKKEGAQPPGPLVSNEEEIGLEETIKMRR